MNAGSAHQLEATKSGSPAADWKRGIVTLTAALLATVFLLPSVASAQPATADSGGIEVVTVTAQRRVQNLQKVALSAIVRTGAELKNQNVYTLQQLQNQAPGLSIQPPVTSETYINIRGVGIQQTSPVSSNGVAIYIDDVYIPSLIDTVDTFYDLKNVEVLRGPQGTLVGANADGGAVFINSVQPSFDRVKGYIEQTIGNFNDYRTEGGVNLPISDSLAARIAFVHETRDSFTKNIGATATSPNPTAYPPGQNQPGNVDFTATRVQVAYRPSNSFHVTFRFEPYQSRTDGFAKKPYEKAAGVLGAYYGLSPSPYYDPWAASHAGDHFLINYDMPQHFNISGQRSAITAVWHATPSVELKNIASYQSGYEDDRTDIDASSAPANEYLLRHAEFYTYTEELDALSTSSDALQWSAGLYYLNERKPLVLSFNGAHATALSLIAYTQNYGVFASGTYTFSPHWSVELGGRYSWDNLPRTEVALGPVHNKTFTTSDKEPSYSAKIKWQANQKTLVYASLATGYKAGGLNLDIPPHLIVPPYKPETNLVEELGLKTELLNGHLRFDGDIFNSVYRNFQIAETLTAPVTVPYTQNVSEASIQGAEAEITGAFSALQFNLGASYLDASTAKQFNFVGPTGITYSIPKGTAVPFAPRWMVTAGLQYSFPIGGGVLTPRLQYQYQAKQNITIAHNIYPLSLGATIPAHGTFDFMATFAAQKHWQIQAYVLNLLDRHYVSVAQLSPVAGMVPLDAYGPPRQYGVKLAYRF